MYCSDGIAPDFDKPELTWQKFYGDVQRDDWANCIIPTHDGGYIFAGGTRLRPGGSTDPSDIYIAKLDVDGNLKWDTTYGTPYDDEAYKIIHALDGGYIIAGMLGINGTVSAAHIMKINEKGDSVWANVFTSADDNAFFGIDTSESGGYIMVGKTLNRTEDVLAILLLEVSPGGGEIWRQVHIHNRYAVGYGVVTVEDGYAIAGYAQSYGISGLDVYLFRVDSVGNVLWDSLYGGPHYDKGFDLELTSDSGFIIVGVEDVNPGLGNAYIIRTDSSGKQMWTRIVGGSASDWAVDVTSLHGSNYAITGMTESMGNGGRDVLLIRIDDNGSVFPLLTFGGADDDTGSSIIPSTFGGFVIAGSTLSNRTYNDAYIIKTSSQGYAEPYPVR
jgi:hypothetical protein